MEFTNPITRTLASVIATKDKKPVLHYLHIPDGSVPGDNVPSLGVTSHELDDHEPALSQDEIALKLVEAAILQGERAEKDIPLNENNENRFNSNLAEFAADGTPQYVQRKLITRLKNVQNYVAVNGRIGPATVVIASSKLLSLILDKHIDDAPAPVLLEDKAFSFEFIAYDGAGEYVTMARKPTRPDTPGLVFVYREDEPSQCKVVEVGFYPQRQFARFKVS